MSGLVSAFAAFQPEALLLALWCAGMWLVAARLAARTLQWLDRRRLDRCDLRRAAWRCRRRSRRSSASSLRAGAPACVRGAARAPRGGARTDGRVGRCGTSTPTATRGRSTPSREAGPAAQLARAHAGALRRSSTINTTVFDGLYTAGLATARRARRSGPRGFVAVAVAVALRGRAADRDASPSARLAARARRGAARVGSFLSIYLTLFLSSVVAGAAGRLRSAHFGGYAAAWAGVAGIGFTAPLGGRRWLAPRGGRCSDRSRSCCSMLRDARRVSARLPRTVGLNALFLEPDRVGGTETYVRQLVPELAQAAPDDAFVLYLAREAAATHWDVPANVRVARLRSRRSRGCSGSAGSSPGSSPRRVAMASTCCTRSGRRRPLASPMPRVVTVHDLIFEHYPRGLPGDPHAGAAQAAPAHAAPGDPRDHRLRGDPSRRRGAVRRRPRPRRRRAPRPRAPAASR